MKRVKILISAALALFIIAGMFPVSALAAGSEAPEIIFIPSSAGGNAYASYTDDLGTYVGVKGVVNGEVQEVYIRAESSRDLPFSAPIILANPTRDANGIITGGAWLNELNPEKYTTGTGMLGTKPADGNIVEIGFYNGDGKGGSGSLNGSSTEETTPTYLECDETTRVYLLGVGEEENGVRLVEEGISIIPLDNNDQVTFYTENGVAKEIFIIQIDPTTRMSTPFLESGGAIYQLTLVGGHGSVAGTTKRLAITPLTTVTAPAKFEFYIPELGITRTVEFEAGAEGCPPLETETNADVTTGGGESTQYIEYVRESYRASNVNIMVTDVTDPDNPKTALGYAHKTLVDAETGDVIPDIWGLSGLEGSAEVVWYNVTKTADNNNIAVTSATEIYRTAYSGIDSVTLPGNIAAENVGSITAPIIYAESYPEGFENDQRMGVTPYKVVTNFSDSGTGAAASLNNSGTQYARLTLDDNGPTARTATVLDIAQITAVGNAESVTVTGGTVTGASTPLASGDQLQYAMAEADAVDGVITLNITAEAGGFSSAAVSTQPLIVNGESANCEKYAIDGYNYLKLRDVAALLNGTGSQFAVSFDLDERIVYVQTGERYTPDGKEFQIDEDKSATCVKSDWTLIVDGAEINASAYMIGGNNYYKLRDLGAAIGFDVDYLEADNAAVINSK